MAYMASGKAWTVLQDLFGVDEAISSIEKALSTLCTRHDYHLNYRECSKYRAVKDKMRPESENTESPKHRYNQPDDRPILTVWKQHVIDAAHEVARFSELSIGHVFSPTNDTSHFLTTSLAAKHCSVLTNPPPTGPVRLSQLCLW